MRPLAPLLLLALLLPLALPAFAQVPAPGNQPVANIPTQQDFLLGPLNITIWVMRDTRTIVYSPTETNPLAIIWNYNFTAGALGIVYVRAAALDNSSYDFQARLTGPGSQVTIENATFFRNITPPLRPSADNAFQFNVAGAATPGPLQLGLALQVWDNSTGTPMPNGSRSLTLDLNIIDPVPSFAVKKVVGDTTVFGWVSGGAALSRGGTGCLGGANAFRSDVVPQGSIGIACLLAVTHSQQKLQLNASIHAPGGVLTNSPPWNSQPFNATTGGLSAPVTSFPFTVLGNMSTGQVDLAIDFVLRDANGTELGRDSLTLPFSVEKAVVIPTHGPNWLFQAPVLIAAIAGLGYLVQQQRKPKLQPRSQALREMGTGKRSSAAAAESVPATAEEAAEQAAEQREAVQEVAWEKKRKILEAKREDILKSIRLAEERKTRGEITEHVLNGIKERKERQLEQVEHEMEELR